MSVSKWTKIKEETAYKGWGGYAKILKKTFVLPDGRQSQFDVHSQRGAVCVFALAQNSNVILARQFRPGTEEIYDELPGGALEENEEPLAAAKRELREETGYTGDFRHVTIIHVSPYSNMLIHCFVATNCKKTTNQHLDEKEFISVIEKTLDEFKKQLRSGKLSDINVAYLCMDFLQML